jgi:hypothetical protein
MPNAEAAVGELAYDSRRLSAERGDCTEIVTLGAIGLTVLDGEPTEEGDTGTNESLPWYENNALHNAPAISVGT